MPKSRSLPGFLSPMLASPGKAFDSDKHLFEIKWDGMRTLAFVDSQGYRLINRHETVLTDLFPEFNDLRQLPAGTVLDGELVVLRDGKPDLERVMTRFQTSSQLKIRTASRGMPATFIAFDQLYAGYESIMEKTLKTRRQQLEETLEAVESERIILSVGIIGAGKKYFANAVEQDLEGVVAKRLSSHYVPGVRSAHWTKVKRRSTLYCAIIGFVPDGEDDFEELVLASDVHGDLRYVGRVGAGITNLARKRLNELLWSRMRKRPIVECKGKASWIDPGLYAEITFLQFTSNGELREPVFVDLIEDG